MRCHGLSSIIKNVIITCALPQEKDVKKKHSCSTTTTALWELIIFKFQLSHECIVKNATTWCFTSRKMYVRICDVWSALAHAGCVLFTRPVIIFCDYLPKCWFDSTPKIAGCDKAASQCVYTFECGSSKIFFTQQPTTFCVWCAEAHVCVLQDNGPDVMPVFISQRTYIARTLLLQAAGAM